MLQKIHSTTALTLIVLLVVLVTCGTESLAAEMGTASTPSLSVTDADSENMEADVDSEILAEEDDPLEPYGEVSEKDVRKMLGFTGIVAGAAVVTAALITVGVRTGRRS